MHHGAVGPDSCVSGAFGAQAFWARLVFKHKPVQILCTVCVAVFTADLTPSVGFTEVCVGVCYILTGARCVDVCYILTGAHCVDVCYKLSPSMGFREVSVIV